MSWRSEKDSVFRSLVAAVVRSTRSCGKWRKSDTSTNRRGAAGIVGEELRRRVPMGQRTVRQAPFRVLVGANMPAVLVELGSLADPDDERRLTSARFQNNVVEAIVASILRFRDYLERTGRAMANTAGRHGAAGTTLFQVRYQ